MQISTYKTTSKIYQITNQTNQKYKKKIEIKSIRNTNENSNQNNNNIRKTTFEKD